MSGTKIRILVTDDDHVLRAVARSALESRFFDVSEAGDGEVAISILEDNSFDFVLLDIDMPKVNGFEVIEKIRSNPATKNLPIMVITSRSDFADIERAYELGATSFTVKPIDWNLLIHQIHFILRSSRMEIALRQAVNAVEAVSSYKTNLLSIISHELRTPIHTIVGYTEILRTILDRTELDNTPAQYLDELDAATKRLNGSLEDIFFLAGAVENGLQLSEDCYQIAPMIEDVMAAWRSNAAEKNVELLFENLLPKDAELKCDQVMFCRAFGNLVDNAIKFSSSHSTVILSVGFTSNGDLVCSVQDEGPGIRPQVLVEMQELFSQGDMSTTRAVEGLGLGLAICKSIIEKFGGRVMIRPREIGGTIAMVILPASMSKSLANPDNNFVKLVQHVA